MPELTQRNFTGGELDPALHSRADLEKFRTGLTTLRNFKINAQGGVSNREGLEFVGETKDSNKTSRLIQFEFNKEQAYALEFGDLYMRVYKDGAVVLEPAKTILSATQANPVVIGSAAHGFANGDEVFITGASGMNEINDKRYIVANADIDDFQLFNIDGTAFTTYSGSGTVSRIFELVTPYIEADIPLLKFTQSADVMTLTHPSYTEKDLSRTDHHIWTLSEISYAPTVSTVIALSAVAGGAGGGDNNKTYEYVVTAVSPTGEESLHSNAVSVNTPSLSETHYVDVTWGLLIEIVDHYNVYKAESETSDIYGWIGESKTATFRDYNLLPDISDTPNSVARDPFSLANDQPGVVGYYQQRQIFGRTNNNIQTMFATQSGNFKSMRQSRPVRSDDSLERTIASKRVNEIRHFVELDALLILTSGGEWRVTEGADGVMTPSSVGFRRQTDYGSEHVPPVTIGNSALYVQIGGKTVREMAYSLDSDSFGSADLSLLAKHLFKNRKIKEWAYAQEPDGIVWTVMDDGAMIGLTFQKEHKIFGWHKHDTQGLFESVISIPENDFDSVYVIVKRTINGIARRYIERMKVRSWTVAEDAFIVDSGLTFIGTPSTTISGLDHLNGMVVVALADGNVVINDSESLPLTVQNGAITLPVAASKVHIGLSYVSDFETLDVDPIEAAVRGKPLNIGECVVKVLDSRGGYVGPSVGKLNELPSRRVADSFDPLALRSEDIRIPIEEEWSSNGHLLIRQTDPLPITILSVVPDVDVG